MRGQAMRLTLRVFVAVLGFALFATGYGLLEDGFDGFAQSKSALSWPVLLGGLMAAGVFSIAFEAGLEAGANWLFEPDHWYSTGPRRSTRLAWAVFVAGGLALVIWMTHKVMRS